MVGRKQKPAEGSIQNREYTLMLYFLEAKIPNNFIMTTGFHHLNASVGIHIR